MIDTTLGHSDVKTILKLLTEPENFIIFRLTADLTGLKTSSSGLLQQVLISNTF